MGVLPSAYKQVCPVCGEFLTPIIYTAIEHGKNMAPTGRKKAAVNYLECEWCGHKETVDDSLDGPWY